MLGIVTYASVFSWTIPSSSCPKSHIAKYLTLALHYIWSDDRLRSTGIYSEGVLSVPARGLVFVFLLHH